MTRQKATWKSVWLIVGPRLPRTAVRLGTGVVLTYVENEAYERFSRDRDITASFYETKGDYVAHFPPRHEVLSRYQLTIDVEAEDEWEAMVRAEQIANRLTASLSLSIPGGRYFAGLRRTMRVDESSQPFRLSESSTVSAPPSPSEFEPGDIDRALNIFGMFANNEVAENAYVHLQTAWQLESTAGSKPLERSILQHYVLCMETVVTSLASKIRAERADTIRSEERRFALDFAEQLPLRADKPEAIREASTKLRNISLANMLPAIDSVAPILKIDDEILTDAKNLYRFRSRTLSHPGRSGPADFAIWLASEPSLDKFCRADAVARTFLANFCRISSSKKKTKN